VPIGGGIPLNKGGKLRIFNTYLLIDNFSSR